MMTVSSFGKHHYPTLQICCVTWYKPEQVGHNVLEKFVGNLSEMCEFSQHYTNHCIRVMATTNLCRNNFSLKQIMSVTDNKSIQSLGIHHRVKSDEKMIMGMSLTCGLMIPAQKLKISNIVTIMEYCIFSVNRLWSNTCLNHCIDQFYKRKTFSGLTQ